VVLFFRSTPLLEIGLRVEGNNGQWLDEVQNGFVIDPKAPYDIAKLFIGQRFSQGNIPTRAACLTKVDDIDFAADATTGQRGIR
jgi:hypothetical protein